MFTCRRLCPADHGVWLALRRQLWPDSDEADAAAWPRRDDAVTLLAESSSGAIAGFVEAGERAYADGCDSSPVAYLEGWYVRPEFRRTGVGSLLLQAVEAWAGSAGYRELASDALLENVSSQAAHRAVGFEEVERAVRYRKGLLHDGAGSPQRGIE